MLLDEFTYEVQKQRIQSLSGTKKPLQDLIKELHDTYSANYYSIIVDTPEATSIFYYCLLHDLAVRLCTAQSPTTIKIHDRFIYCLGVAYRGATPELYNELLAIGASDRPIIWYPSTFEDLVKINDIIKQTNPPTNQLSVDCYRLNGMSSYLIKELSTVSKIVYFEYVKHILGPTEPVLNYMPVSTIAPAPTDVKTDLTVFSDILNILTKLKEPNND